MITALRVHAWLDFLARIEFYVLSFVELQAGWRAQRAAKMNRNLTNVSWLGSAGDAGFPPQFLGVTRTGNIPVGES